MKSWFASKTMWVGMIQGAAGVLNNLMGIGVVDSEAGWALGVSGALMILLRMMTSEPVKRLPIPLMDTK